VGDDYGRFSERVYQKTGIDLSKYKEKQMKRRLTSLLEKRGCNSFDAYFNLIMKNNDLYHEFLDRITINVSEFYRNHKRWEILEQKILPSLIKKGKKLNIWSAACSTGEEPYTLAMAVSKYIPLEQVNILATDIDENVLQKAKQGIYTDKSLKEVPKYVKDKFFVEKQGNYYVDDKIRKCITFQKHNLLKDPYKQGFDLIVCRNVLIYFTEEAKAYIYGKFRDSLVEDGVLFVGSTEQIFNPKQYSFKTLETFFYQKQANH
jgi:chemotaxis protein methyltransferase CheR